MKAGFGLGGPVNQEKCNGKWRFAYDARHSKKGVNRQGQGGQPKVSLVHNGKATAGFAKVGVAREHASLRPW